MGFYRIAKLDGVYKRQASRGKFLLGWRMIHIVATPLRIRVTNGGTDSDESQRAPSDGNPLPHPDRRRCCSCVGEIWGDAMRKRSTRGTRNWLLSLGVLLTREFFIRRADKWRATIRQAGRNLIHKRHSLTREVIKYPNT